MRGPPGSIRRAVWNGHEERLRAPWRLALGGVGVLVLGNGLGAGALAAAQLGTWLQPTLRASWTVVVAAVALAAAVVGVCWIVRVVDGRRLADVGLAWTATWRREAAVGAAVGAAMATAVVAAALGLGLATATGVVTNRAGTFALTAEHVFVNTTFWLVVFAGIGLAEEVVLRGFVLVNVAEGMRGQTGNATDAALAAVVGSATASGLVYVAGPDTTVLGLANVVVLGLVLGATVAVTGRLALAVGVHAAWYATVGIGFGLPVGGLETGVAVVGVELAGPAILTGGGLGPGGGLLAVVGLVVGIVALAYWLVESGTGLTVDETVAVPNLR